MNIFQKTILLKPRPRGFHIITREIEEQILELKSFKTGIAHIFIQHTSASLTINENADPSVRSDFETVFKRLISEDEELYEHTAEGPDDMTSHAKASILGNSVTIPITNGHFNLGTWQGIYLGEHREQARSRKIVVTIFGQ